MLVQCIRRTVTRWGAVRVAIGRCLLVVVGEDAPSDDTCPLCGGRPGALRCRLAGSDTCLRCALEGAAPEHGAATIGVGAMAPAAPQAARTAHSGSHGTRGDATRLSIAKRRQ